MADSLEWYYRRGDERGGPVGHEAMCRMVADRSMPLDAKVWREGFPRFIPASALPGFVDAAEGKTGAQAQGPPAEGAPLTAIMSDPWTPTDEALAQAEAEAAAAGPEAISADRPAFAGGQLIRDRGADEPPRDVPQRRPFVRFFARYIDSVMAGFLIAFAIKLGAPLPNTWPQFILYLVGLLLVEPLMLAAFGTTPGKWLLRVTVQGLDGERPNLAESIFRLLAVRIKGEGLGILYIPCTLLAYSRLLNRGATSWDENGGFIVRHDRVGGVRALLAAAAIVGGTAVLWGPLLPTQRDFANAVIRLAGATQKGEQQPGADRNNASITPTGPRSPARPAPPPRKSPVRKIVM